MKMKVLLVIKHAAAFRSALVAMTAANVQSWSWRSLVIFLLGFSFASAPLSATPPMSGCKALERSVILADAELDPNDSNVYSQIYSACIGGKKAKELKVKTPLSAARMEEILAISWLSQGKALHLAPVKVVMGQSVDEVISQVASIRGEWIFKAHSLLVIYPKTHHGIMDNSDELLSMGRFQRDVYVDLVGAIQCEVWSHLDICDVEPVGDDFLDFVNAKLSEEVEGHGPIKFSVSAEGSRQSRVGVMSMRGSWALGTLLDVACFYGKATWAADNLTITITKK